MAEYLLDTHTLIWFLSDNKLLSDNARNIIRPDNTSCYISIASLWEMSIKASLNKLDLKTPFNKIESELSVNDIRILPITFKDIQTLNSLPFHHRDPFDRIIISQGISNNLTIITKDEAFQKYNVTLLW